MTVDAVKNIEDLAAFVAESPVSYLAARTVARRLQAAGFTELVETEAWDPQIATGRHFVVRDGAIIAWAGGAKAQKASGYRVLGAHTDSPSLKVKPSSSITTKGWHQIAVENYGGALLNSFLDRELCVAGPPHRPGGRGAEGPPGAHRPDCAHPAAGAAPGPQA